MAPDLMEMDAAVLAWIDYRQRIQAAQKLQAGGFQVKDTPMKDFVKTSNAMARRFMNAIGTENGDYIEAVGELALTAAKNIQAGVKEW